MTKNFVRKIGGGLAALQLGFLVQTSFAATFSITPAAISNSYVGNLSLQIGGVNTGETVLVEKFLDANGNGVVDAGDVLVQSFQLTDGQASVIGGVTNLNVPGDADGPNGAITVALPFRRDGFEMLAGHYAFKLTSSGGTVTNLFTVTNAAYAQSISGAVVSSGTNVPNARVLLLSLAGGSRKPAGGAVADNSGNYSIKAPPGAYVLTAFKSNYVADVTGPVVTLNAGTPVTTNLNLISATNFMSGKIVDAANASLGVPGVPVTATSTNNLLAIGFTDANGNFNLPATASQWKLRPQGRDTDLHGYLAPGNSLKVQTGGGSVSGLTISLTKATALFYGSVRDDQNNPVAGFVLSGSDNGGVFSSDGATDANGNYVAGVSATGWNISVSDPVDLLLGFGNYVFPFGTSTSFSAGQAAPANFVLLRATNLITGWVRDNNNAPVAGVQVSAYAIINGTYYSTYSVTTDSGGNYALSVPNGFWTVSVSCSNNSGNNSSLSSLGFECVPDQPASINNANAVVNFTVLPAGVLSFAVTPSAVSNQYAGPLTFQVSGLATGQTVVVEKYLDANTNGVIDAGDSLLQRLLLTDGQASVIGGVTNINAPGDMSSAPGFISDQLSFAGSSGFAPVSGKYAFRLASTNAAFTPVTNAFTVTNLAYPQSFSGFVTSGVSNVPNAVIVLLAPKANGDQTLVAGTVADNSGHYSIAVSPGTYLLGAFRSNYVSPFSTVVTINAGNSVVTNLSLIPATGFISGRTVDSVNTSQGISGLSLIAQSTNGLLATASTDSGGNFTLPVVASQWKVDVQGQELMLKGYLPFANSTTFLTTTGSVSGATLPLTQATALIYGMAMDAQNNPLAGVGIHGEDRNNNGPSQFSEDLVTDQNGNYVLGASATDWNVSINSSVPAYANYVFAPGGQGFTLGAGQAVMQDFTGVPATRHITGQVKNSGNNPVSGADVYAYDTTFGYQASDVLTDANGNYSLNVVNGSWNVGLNCNGGNNTLSSLGYQCVNEQTVNISNGDGVANFTVQPCGAVQITTTSMPNGSVEAFYSAQVTASSCFGPLTWTTTNAAALPPGLSLGSDGTISGNPNTPGTYNFWVRVNDGQSTANQAISINISAALQITTQSLNNGTQGTFYSASLGATNGLPPYSWSFSPASGPLPSNMTLYSDGTISGTPGGTGTFNISVRVTDSTTHTVDQALSLTINSSSSPLQVTTTTLPNGTAGVNYSQQLFATGGQPSYGWSIENGSAFPPANVVLSTNGLLSGIPATNGTFQFYVLVTDSVFNTADQLLSLTINNPVLQLTNTALPFGTVGGSYTTRLGALGGQPPYTFSLAPASGPLPPGLSIAANGTISGTATNTGQFAFLAQVTDASFTSVHKSLSITINQRPNILSTARLSSTQFRLTVSGAIGQNYTVQTSTNLTFWSTVTATNPVASSFTVTDGNATNSPRFYRVLVGP